MSWSANNAAHRYLWIFARSEHIDFAIQDDKLVTFVEGGEWENTFVIGSAAGAGAEVIQADAQIFAKKFNAWIVVQKDASYEEGFTPSLALSTLAQAMAVPNSRLKDVGDTVDEIYRCKGEDV